MTGIWFWLIVNNPETQVSYESERITLTNIGHKLSHHFEDTSIFKLFKEFIFIVEIVGRYIDRNHAPTCTLYLTDDFKVRISINLDHSSINQMIHDFKTNEDQILRFSLDDSLSLEKYCLDLLTGNSSTNTFVKTIDGFTVGAISIES